MLENIKDYDSAVVVAENDKQVLYITSWGKVNKYVAVYKETKDLWESTVGQAYNYVNKTQFITNAFDHAVDHFGFKPEDVLTKYPRNKTVTISQAEQVAINTAIRLLNQSNSDHADQCRHYLTTLKNKL
ncbi:MAG: hypothetical protein GY928_03910 [Colwellia sp.]|nr:hypothetical protein [Colwellia sp.]